MPEGIERFDIPADDVWVELVIWLRLKVVLDRVRRYPAIAGHTDFFDAIWIRSLQRLRLYSCKNRSEEHTSELQSHSDLVCRLLLEKKKKKYTDNIRRC